MPRLKVNGAELYYDMRGDGSPVPLIMGFTGDAGHFETLAYALAQTIRPFLRRCAASGNDHGAAPSGLTKEP